MPRESLSHKKERAAEIEKRMFDHYGEGACSLDYMTPFMLVCAVVLSAQCTDAAVNKVTPQLFDAYGTPEAMAQASVEDVERIIHSLGFYHAKARNLVRLGQMVMTDFGGEVPNDLELLQKLPGVGRKTANVVMCEAFRNPQGIAVDTHVFRIAHQLKLAGPSADTPQNRSGVAEGIPAKRLALHQPPMGAFRTRLLHRPPPALRRLLHQRSLPFIRHASLLIPATACIPCHNACHSGGASARLQGSPPA